MLDLFGTKTAEAGTMPVHVYTCACARMHARQPYDYACWQKQYYGTLGRSITTGQRWGPTVGANDGAQRWEPTTGANAGGPTMGASDGGKRWGSNDGVPTMGADDRGQRWGPTIPGAQAPSPAVRNII